MWSDPIADMLTRIRNAERVHSEDVKIPSSKLKVGIAKVLKDEGYINGYDVIEDSKQGVLRVDLKYGPRGETVLHKIQRASRPGCRISRWRRYAWRSRAGLSTARYRPALWLPHRSPCSSESRKHAYGFPLEGFSALFKD